MSPDVIFGLIIFVGVIFLITTLLKVTGTANDDEFKSEKNHLKDGEKNNLNDPDNQPPFHDTREHSHRPF